MASACAERYAAVGSRTQQVLHPGRQLWVPLDGFEMQTAGAMVCDSHHVPSTGPSTGLEALVVRLPRGSRRSSWCRGIAS